MTRGQDMIDRRPGSLPDIRTNTRGITFVMVPPGPPRGRQLVIRCDADGGIWISIQPEQVSSDW